MTTKKKIAAPARGKQLKLKKETLKDLDAKGKAGKVKGGGLVELPNTIRCTIACTIGCPTYLCPVNLK